MVAVVLLVLVTMVLSHWVVEPLVLLLTPVFTLAWLPWAALLLLLWLFAGSTARERP